MKYKISYLSCILQYGLFILLSTIAGPGMGQRKASTDRVTLEKNGASDFNLAQNMKLGGSNLDFHGFEGYSFSFHGREAKIIRPKVTAVGHPWVWRSRFWGHEPQVDIGLLEHGYHVVYCDVAELFGNEEALTIWDGFYRKLQDGGLNKKSAMEGMIPLLHVVGDKDDVVPIAENALPFAEEIRRAGGSIEIIHKPEVGHHPHCLVDPSPIIDFILKANSK
ncbi:hypothetical protein ACK8HY_01690 [Sphingobacterium sp. NGMCC 1.201703]|uniref:hypothetical protein n=1 Tax=Sphingobacterium sp. NGMCC 1.201703 TaxID=3388657 RepID=UPI0039FCDD28